MPLKVPTIVTMVFLTLYLTIFLFIAKQSDSGVIVNILILMITMSMLGMVIFAVSSTACILICKKDKEEIERCHRAIKEKVSEIVNSKKLKSSKSNTHDLERRA